MSIYCRQSIDKMKAKMATKEQRSVTIHDVFVNKLRYVHDLENNRLVQHQWVASDENLMVLGLKLGWNLCLNVASVARTVTNFFFEWIPRTAWMDDNCFQTDSPSHWNRSHFPFEWIAQAVQMDDNFFPTDSPSRSNGWQFFDEQFIPRAVQTDTKSVRKRQTVRNVFTWRDWQNMFTMFII